MKADITPACHAGQNGKIRLLINEGMPPYQIQWEDGSKQVDRSVSAGSYRVTITDALGCSASGNFTVSKYAEFRASAITENTSRPGKSNGSIALQVSGGTPPYHYSWIASNAYDFPPTSVDTKQFRKLPSGHYKIVVFDAGGCYCELETEVR